MPGIDIDAILIAIRIATFGDKMGVTQTCGNCETENDYDVELGKLLDYFNNLKFINTIPVDESLTIRIRPLQYEEMNYFSIENFKLQKTLYQSAELKEEEKQQTIDQIYKDLSELQLQLFLTAVESVQVDGHSVTEKQYIEEWMRNADRNTYKLVKTKLEENKEAWNIPSQPVKCANCGTESTVTVTLDQANFFA